MKSNSKPNSKPQPETRILEQIVETIRSARTLCVVGHVRPDGDCVGSQLGLTLALRDLGKKVACWNEDPLPEKLAFLDAGRLFQAPRRGARFDCVVATDCATFERLGKVGDCVAERQTLINIDHHLSNTAYGDLNWIAPDKASTGELIFRLMKAGRWPITEAIADCLFTAISTDTGSFQYPSTRPETFRVAGELVERGAKLGRICEEVYHSFSLSRVRLVRHLYSQFRLTQQNQIGYLWLKRSLFTRTGALPDDTEGLIDHIRAIQPVVIACVFEELAPDLTRISLRSKDAAIDVSTIAAQFGGGGHRSAAGARIPGSPVSAQRRVLAALKRALVRG
jgi:phosphoesterase RecJ-like protein